MKCIDCDGFCSCHISAPCEYCQTHSECEECGDLICLICNDFIDEGLCLACDMEKDEVTEC